MSFCLMWFDALLLSYEAIIKECCIFLEKWFIYHYVMPSFIPDKFP